MNTKTGNIKSYIMLITNKTFKTIILILLFYLSFSIIDIIRSESIAFMENAIKAIATICVLYGCKYLSKISDRLNK